MDRMEDLGFHDLDLIELMGLEQPILAGYLYCVKCPTLIVWGEHDGVVPVTHGHVYQAEIGEAAFTVLPSSGHRPHLEQPEALANAVLEYLEQR